MAAQYDGVDVGAVIDRPAEKCCDFALVFGEFVHDTARAINDRPYNISAKWYAKR